jgi:hypothetical protein
VLATFLDAAY